MIMQTSLRLFRTILIMKKRTENGGYATVTYVITSGGSKEKVSIDKKQTKRSFRVKMQALKLAMLTVYIFLL